MLHRFRILFILGILLNPYVSKAVDSLGKKKLSLGVEVGYQFNAMSGDMKKFNGDLIQEFESLENGNDSYNGSKGIKSSLSLGITAGYKFRNKIAFRGGLRVSRRGYRLKLAGVEKNDVYQIDDLFNFKEIYRVTVLDVPISTVFTLNNRLMINGGAILGFAFRSSSKMTYHIKHESKVNGSTVEKEVNKTEVNMPEAVKNPYVGIFAGIDYKLSPAIFLGATFLKTTSYAEFNSRKLSDHSLLLSIKYFLSI